MRKALLLASLAAVACTAPPREDDFFLPPYAEKGCWARFYEQAGFGTPMRQLEGPSFVEAVPGAPVRVPHMEEAGVQPLFHEARSLMTGPNAKLVGYSGTLFRGEATVVERGSVLPDASVVGYPERFASMRLQCEG